MPGRPQDVRDRHDLVGELLLLLDLLDDRLLGAQRRDDLGEDRRVDELDVEARVERVRVEVARQVFLALLLEPLAPQHERRLLADVLDLA